MVSGVVYGDDDDGDNDDGDDNGNDDDADDDDEDDDDEDSDKMLEILGLKSAGESFLRTGKSPVEWVLSGGWQITSPNTKSFGSVTDFELLFLTERMYLS